MFKKLITISIIIIATFVGGSAFVPRSVYAGNFDDATESAKEGAGFGDPVAGDVTKIDTVITMVVDTLTIIVGVVAVIMIIIAGFKYVTSGGDGQKVASAKTALIYAVIGLIVAALAQMIVFFVLGTASGNTTIGSSASTETSEVSG